MKEQSKMDSGEFDRKLGWAGTPPAELIAGIPFVGETPDQTQDRRRRASRVTMLGAIIELMAARERKGQ